MAKRFIDEDLCDYICESDLSSLDLSSDSEEFTNEVIIDDFSDNEQMNTPSTSQAKWSWSLLGSKRNHFIFSGTSGVKIKKTNPDNVLEIFESIQSAEIISKIVSETNAYAYEICKQKFILGLLKKKSRLQNWKDINFGEMRLLDAMLLLMGIIKKPDFQMYFSKDPVLATPFFGEIMPKDRFLLLLQHLYFSDSISNDSSDKLYKIRDLLNLYKHSFQSAYYPEKNICIDESLLLWKGRLRWKMHAPQVRLFGIEGYFLCESNTGYVYNFEVYSGKGTDLQLPPCATEIAPEYLNHSTKVVLHLMEGLLDKGFYLAMDSYYTSPPLFDFLVSHMTDAVGTLRKNRKGIPKEILKAKLKKGQDITMYKGKLMVMQWRDKKEVLMISTTHDAERKIVNEGNLEKSKPLVCIDYKMMMGGVDHTDQVISSFDAARSHLKKYYKQIYLRFLDIAVLNSFIIHKKLGGKNTLLKFKIELIKKLIEKYSENTSKAGRYAPSSSPLRLTARHFPNFTPPKEGKPGRSSLRCRVCAARGKRKDTSYMCKECDVGLCIVPCFEIYHTKVDFSI